MISQNIPFEADDHNLFYLQDVTAEGYRVVA